MSKNNHIINSFVAGEVAPKFFSRSDTQQYNQSCEEIYNAIVSPQGGAGTRPGTMQVREIARANGAAYAGQVKLLPFHAVDGTRWNIAMTAYTPDEPNTPYSNQSLEWKATSEGTDNGFDSTNVGLATLAGAAAVYSNYYSGVPAFPVQYAQAGNTMIVVNGRHRPLRITFQDDGTARKFKIRPFPDPGEWSTSALTSVTIPAAADQTWRQSPFLAPVVQSTGNKLSLNLAKGTDTLYTITNGTGGTQVFTNAWVGKIFKFTRQTQVVVILITSRTSSTVLRGIPIGGTNITNSTNYDYGGATADQFYEESAWSDSRGWPSSVCFFEGRLVLGGQTGQEFGATPSPDEIWFSQVNNILKFDYRGIVTDAGYPATVVTSDPFSVTLKSNVLNTVKWLSPKKNITTGTDFEEFVVSGPAVTKTIGPDNIMTSGETATGSAPAQAVRVEAGTIFLDRTRRKLRELAYNFDENSLRASDLNILAPHMGVRSLLAGRTLPPDYLGYVQESYFTEIVRQALPLGVVWALDNSGSFCGMTREREQNVTAWHYHEIAGTVNSMKPFVQSLSVFSAGTSRYGVISTNNGNTQGDELWMAVTRQVGYNNAGVIAYTPRTYLERMDRDWEGPKYDTQWISSSTNRNLFAGIIGSAPIYMDCTSVHSQAGFTAGVLPLAALPQGAGAVVDVLLNGVYLGKKTIALTGLDLAQDIDDMGLSGGNYTVLVGFAYTSRIVPLTPEVPAQTGSSMGQPRRVHAVVVKFDRTVSAKIGRRSNQDEEQTPVDPLEELPFKPGTNQNDPIPLFTGDYRVTMPQGYETLPRIVIQNDLPFPMYVTGLVAKMVAYE